MKICILTTSHLVSDARVFNKEARSLRREFGDVTMLCQHPKENDEIDGVKVIGVPPRSGGGIMARFRVMRELYKKGLAFGADIYHSHEPDAAFVCWLIKRKLKKCGIIYDSHEIYPDMFSMNIKNPLLSKLVRNILYAVEKFIVKRVDLVIATNEYRVGYFKKMAPGVNVIIIDNVPSLDIFKEAARPVNDPVVLCYEGILNFNRAMRELMTALKILKERGVRFKFRYMGKIKEKELEWFDGFAAENDLSDCVENLGFVNYDELGRALATGDIGVLTLLPVLNYVYSTPNKLYNYMRYKMPFVAPDFVEIGRVVRAEQCALLMDSSNPEDIADKLQTLIENPKMRAEMGERGYAAVMREYNWGEMERRMFEAYRAIFSRNS